MLPISSEASTHPLKDERATRPKKLPPKQREPRTYDAKSDELVENLQPSCQIANYRKVTDGIVVEVNES
jgi:hypothetical protein